MIRSLAKVLMLRDGEWGMGNGEWGMGNGERQTQNLIRLYPDCVSPDQIITGELRTQV